MKTFDENLIAQGTAFALEAESFSFTKLVDTATSNFQSFVGNVKDYFSDIADELKRDTTYGFAPSPFFERRITRASYSALAEVDVFIPVGLNVTYLELIDGLNDSQAIIDKMIERTFDPAVRYLSMLVGSPENLANISPNQMLREIYLFEKERNEAKAMVAKCFIKNDNRATRRFGDCFARLADWKPTAERLNNLNERQAKTPPKTMGEKIGYIGEILDRLLIAMKANPKAYQVSGVTAKNLSDLVMALGQLAEFYAAYTYIMQMVNHAMADTMKKLEHVVA